MAICAIAAVIATVLFWFRPKGPTYEGKTVEEWFQYGYELSRSQVPPPAPENLRRTEHAFRALGTNAVPYLARRITQSMDYTVFDRWRFKAARSAKGLLDQPTFKELECYLGAYCLAEYSKPPAQMLLPLIEPAFHSTNSHQRGMAILSLMGVSERRDLAVPYILKGLEDSDNTVQRYAAQALEGYGAEAIPALTRLVVVAQSPFTETAVAALNVLGQLGTNATAAIPFLQGRLAVEIDAERRKAITTALEKIRPPAVP